MKISSKQPRKQRKWRIEAPLHARGKMISSALSKELKQKYTKGSMPVRKGDTAKVMVGDAKGSVGEVTRVDLKNYKIYITGVTLKKSDGTEVERAIDPSNVILTQLFLDDKERLKILERT